MKSKIACVVAFGVAAACGGEGSNPEAQTDLDPEDLAGEDIDGKAEAWDRANNPSYVDSTFLTNMAQLPLTGENRKPIPSDYWAVAHDGINKDWGDGKSPAEKYGQLVGKDIRNAVSEANGVKSQSGNKACNTNADCTDLMDGSICAESFDGAMKRCIPTWFGICHGWAPYAVSEPQAKHSVTRDGVTFHPADLDALMSMAYTDIESKFISSRCNRGGAGDPITYDSLGTPVYGECADMNPGTWHVLVGNMIGLRKQGFVLDQTLNYEVWNQPTWKYTTDIREVTPAEANLAVGAAGAGTQLFAGNIAAQGSKTGVYTATAAGRLTFSLSGLGDGDLYVRKGAAPTETTYDCRPYETTSKELCTVAVAAGDKIHWSVLGYQTTNEVALNVSGAGINSGIAGAVYQFNPAAKKLWQVKMAFTFVVEADPGREPIDAADSFKTASYEYIVEADANGNIIGGEWIGESKTTHPDFAWWVKSKPLRDVAGIDYDLVKSLNDEAADLGSGPTTPGTVATLLSGELLPWKVWKRSVYLTVQVPEGVRSVTIAMEGTGDADLLVGKKGKEPVVYGSNLCESETKGTSVETCTFPVTPGGAPYYVRVRNREDGSRVTVTRTDN
jgi:Transglutaminase elicitor